MGILNKFRRKKVEEKEVTVEELDEKIEKLDEMIDKTLEASISCEEEPITELVEEVEAVEEIKEEVVITPEEEVKEIPAEVLNPDLNDKPTNIPSFL